ncbi:hypothetical protein Tco_0585359 [Tanacetum coccineum]
MAPKRTTRSTRIPPVTPAPNAPTTTTVTEAQLQALIDQGVVAAMAEAEASRVRNGYNSNGSGPRPAQFRILKCNPLDFKGMRESSDQLRWFEKWSLCFSISNCTASVMSKFATALYKTICSYMVDAHIVTEMMFPEEIDKIEKYIGSLPDMIHGSVKASKPKTMQEAIEFTTELMNNPKPTTTEKRAEHCQPTRQAIVTGNLRGPKPLSSSVVNNHEGPCH